MRRVLKLLFDIRVLYGLGGIIMSIVAHEAFHVLMHLDSVSGITFFPNHHAIATVDVALEEGYNLALEEAIAYSITAVVLFVTVIDIFAIHDSRDARPPQQLVFSRHEPLEFDDMHALAVKTKLL